MVGRHLGRWAAIVAVMGLSACATTNPGSSAGIEYLLPRTDVTVTLGIDVLECVPDLKIAASLKMDAVAGARDGAWHVPGAALSSPITQRALTIDVDDDGVITGINATATDKRTAILGDIVKLIASVVPLTGMRAQSLGSVPAAPPSTLACADGTKDTLVVATLLQAKIIDLKKRAPAAPDYVAAKKQIDAVASLLASAQQGLHQDVTATVRPEDVGTVNPYVVALDRAALGQLFKNVDNDTVKLLDIQASIAPLPDPTDTFPDKGSLDACKLSIVLPYAKPVKMTLSPKGGLYEVKQTLSQTIYASQLAQNRDVCISAGFGENRTVGLKLDKFGRVTEFSWQSDATAANITSALAGAAPDAATIATTLRDRKVTRNKAELDRINTEIDLRKARECLAKLDAGGTCDE